MCIFCKIIKGEIPSKKIYEDDDVLAILDISQETRGHTLVLPKRHFDNILEIDSEYLSTIMPKVQMVAKLVTSKLHAEGFNLVVNTGEVAGQTVMHLHFHIIPRYVQETIKADTSEEGLEKVRQEIVA